MKDFLTEDIRFILRTEMKVGDGISEQLSGHLKDNGWTRAGVVVDKGLYENNDYAVKIVEQLGQGLSEIVLLVCDLPEPTYDYLDDVKAKFKERELDCFVGIGGGSTMDLTKGLSTLQTNDGPALTYRGFPKLKNAPLPVVTLPSTAGTGSDVTPYAVFIDTKDNWKFGINSEYNYPRLSLYDPRFLDSCPQKIFASAGMDAMTHTLESFVAKNSTIMSKMFSMQAFELLFVNLKRIADGDRSTETKLSLLVGSACAGAALMNAGAGPAGALSYPLGVYFDVPHGLAGSVFLPGVIKYNVENGFDAYEQLYDLVFQDEGLSATEKSNRFADEIKQLSDSLGIPTNLNGFGVNTDEDRRLIVDNSMQLKAAFDQNPVKFGKSEIENLVNSLVQLQVVR